MFKKIKEFFTGKSAEVQVEAPYKVDGPTPEELKVVAEMTDAIHDTGKPVKAPIKKQPTVKKAPLAKKPRAPKVAK